MAQATVSRKRPCRNCGGRYFAATISVSWALLAIAIALGGIAKAVTVSGVPAAAHGDIPDPAVIVAAGCWAVGGVVVAGLVTLVGRRYRCIACDSRR
ncbi:hypothetical protein [Amycolatopsis tolypomycina]|uniref:Uncharacterized protein n=1 Tax=Amycolatopsis tolypomycina TaxID=208445 RepID=A0A1H4JGX2_9PSEU|nr:hypothetical protein [Amycolatopsis tolypomycina]SEB44842.1 hypothetical protein SAMN04489727_1835 [Amycolatopsis tolypomycina]